MRRRPSGPSALAAGLVLVAIWASAWAPAAAEAAASRVLVAIASEGPEWSLSRLGQRPDLALGLLSASLGTASREQALLDISQGARVAGRLYGAPLPELRLVPTRTGGVVAGWSLVRERARAAPGAVVPGLLAGAAGRAAFVGSGDGRHPAAVVAADEAGRVARVSLGAPTDVGQRALRAARPGGVVVVELPPGAAGRRALDRVLAGRRAGDLVLVAVIPSRGGPALAPTAVAGLGPGAVWSPSTRQPGIVSATDVAPTVLRALGLPVPSQVEGRALDARPGPAPGELARLGARLDSVGARRFAILLWALGSALALVGGLRLARGAEGGRAAARAVVLGAVWAPSISLLTAALAPAAGPEIAVVVGGSLAIGALTDRLGWPRALALPAAAVVVLHAADVASGSRLILASVLGVNPVFGARFYGVGNQLEIVLALCLLLGLGAALAPLRGGKAALAFALGCAAVAVVIGSGRLGADVGGVITLAAGGAAAVAAAMGARLRVVLVVLVACPLLAVTALAALDLATGGDAHFARTVLRAQSPDALLEVAERRLRLSLAGLASPGTALATAVAVVAIGAGASRRRVLLAPIHAAPAFRAGLVGALAATLAGALANDSGPTMLVIGTAGLALGVLYAHARPRQRGLRRGRGAALR